jgi:hypothetical protein
MAIVSHKGLAAYALGSSIVDSDVRWVGWVAAGGAGGPGCAGLWAAPACSAAAVDVTGGRPSQPGRRRQAQAGAWHSRSATRAETPAPAVPELCLPAPLPSPHLPPQHAPLLERGAALHLCKPVGHFCRLCHFGHCKGGGRRFHLSPGLWCVPHAACTLRGCACLPAPPACELLPAAQP